MWRLVFALGLLTIAVASPVGQQEGTTVFEGMRLIAGDGRAPVEDAVFVVNRGVILAVGRRGALRALAGATRVDLTGKTVMPALVNTHGHVGFQNGLTYAAENYTRENITADLHRYAYYGVGTVVSMGTDAGELPYEIQRDQASGTPGGARFFHAGRGFALPNAGPGAAAMRATPYSVTTEDEARAAVRELAARKVTCVKVWVDDRNGTVPKLPPAIYRAIINEAHKNGLNVVAHVFYLADAKDLARAGVDGLAHPVRDTEADDELISLLKIRDVFVMANMGLAERGIRPGRPAWFDDPFLRASVSPAVMQRLSDAMAKRDPAAVERAAATYRRIERSIATLAAAGVRVVLGSDSGVQDHFMGHAEHRELELMAAAGMTPAQVLDAATRVAAQALALDRVGTLAPGKGADFLVLDANPLDDILNTRRISAVYLRGAEVDRGRLRAGWGKPASP